MEKFGKGMFGKGFNISAEVTNGDCPLCNSNTVFVSIHQNIYRCMQCGGDTEQKVNGVISYMPITAAGVGPPPEIKLMDADGPKKA
jgi:ribosomal protein S27AE|tara:strand:+ start:118 stop:375 length:258 start_codon:yes stop_codon:yes gene_type:complete